MFVKHSLTTALFTPVALVGSMFFELRKLLHVTMPEESVNLVEWADSVDSGNRLYRLTKIKHSDRKAD